jgi:hypothetical protein
MSNNQANPNATAAGAVPGGAGPLLRTLGDVNAAVCTDGFCEVPQLQEVPQEREVPRAQEVPQEQRATMGAGK